MKNISKSTRRSHKAGLPPGTMVHIGRKTERPVGITIFDYDEDHFQEKHASTAAECSVFKEKPTVTWINIDGIHDLPLIESIGKCFGLHPLIMEDLVNTEQRPKLEDHESHLFVVLKMLYMNPHDGSVISEQVSLIVGKNFVLSFQEDDQRDVFDPVRERIRTGKGKIRKRGADYLAYSLIDAIVDSYFIILEEIGERVEMTEEELVTRPTLATLEKIHNLKQEILFLRRSVWPLRELLGSMHRGESPLIEKDTLIYIRDVYDHTVEVMDTVENSREMISEMFDIYLSSISNRMNEVMKVLTIIATIFMPLTFIVGIYGMNFEHMPELRAHWGYPLIMGINLAVALGMLYYFRKKRWL